MRNFFVSHLCIAARRSLTVISTGTIFPSLISVSRVKVAKNKFLCLSETDAEVTIESHKASCREDSHTNGGQRTCIDQIRVRRSRRSFCTQKVPSCKEVCHVRFLVSRLTKQASIEKMNNS
jgi:hypothetical protein